MRVMIIPEDFTYDQYILKPLIQAMLNYLGKPRAKVVVCQDPQLGGVDQATNWDQIQDIIEQYGMIDLFLLCVDRDGKAGRRAKLDELEKQACEILPPRKRFFAENAWQEIEVWVLAGHDDLPKEWNWREIRNERDPKEHYFNPFAIQKGLLEYEPELVYKKLTEEAVGHYGSRIRNLCPEDIIVLEDKIRDWIEENL